MYLADIQRALRVMEQRFVQIYRRGESPMVITSLIVRRGSQLRLEDRAGTLETRIRQPCEEPSEVGKLSRIC